MSDVDGSDGDESYIELSESEASDNENGMDVDEEDAEVAKTSKSKRANGGRKGKKEKKGLVFRKEIDAVRAALTDSDEDVPGPVMIKKRKDAPTPVKMYVSSFSPSFLRTSLIFHHIVHLLTQHLSARKRNPPIHLALSVTGIPTRILFQLTASPLPTQLPQKPKSPRQLLARMDQRINLAEYPPKRKILRVKHRNPR